MTLCVAYISQSLIIKRRWTGRMFRISFKKQTFQMKINMDWKISCQRCVFVCVCVAKWNKVDVSGRCEAQGAGCPPPLIGSDVSRKLQCVEAVNMLFLHMKGNWGKTFNFCHFGMEMNGFKETGWHFVRKALSLPFLLMIWRFSLYIYRSVL